MVSETRFLLFICAYNLNWGMEEDGDLPHLVLSLSAGRLGIPARMHRLRRNGGGSTLCHRRRSSNASSPGSPTGA